jgi:hypothetical protein
VIAETRERHNQIGLEVGVIGFLLGEALGNVQRLLGKGAGLLALAEAKQEIAHTLVGDGEVAQEEIGARKEKRSISKKFDRTVEVA